MLFIIAAIVIAIVIVINFHLNLKQFNLIARNYHYPFFLKFINIIIFLLKNFCFFMSLFVNFCLFLFKKIVFY